MTQKYAKFHTYLFLTVSVGWNNMVMGGGADKHERENVKVLSFTYGPYSVDD